MFLRILALLLIFPGISMAATLQIKPEFPAPNQKIKAIVEPANNEYIDNIIWFLNKKQLNQQGQEIDIDYDSTLSEFNLQAVLNFSNRNPQILSKTIQPIKINLAYEADTFVPRFLKVAPLNSQESKTKVWAIVESPQYKTGELLYVWLQNGKKLPKISGTNKKYALIETEFFNETQSITLEVYDPKNMHLLGRKTILILIKKPEILPFLKDEALGWRFDKMINKDIFLSKTRKLLAVPLNMSARGLFDKNILWTWFVDGIKLDQNTSSSPYVEITFKEKNKLVSRLEVQAKSIKHLLQSVNLSFNVLRAGESNQKQLKNNGIKSDTSCFGI